MIDDRVRKGTGSIQQIFALVLAITYGVEYIKSLLFLYHTTFSPSLIFNSEAWTNLSQANLRKLQSLQLKFLKTIVQAPRCTASCFIFMEFGVLPIKQEIDQRKLMFLHHDLCKMMMIQSKECIVSLKICLERKTGPKNAI